MFDVPVVVIDTETTSLDPYNRVIWDIGMVRRSVEGVYESKQFFVELTQREIERADPESLDIGGFEERYNEYEALSKRTVANYLNDFCNGAILAGVTVDFDTRTLHDFVHSQGLVSSWSYHILDIRTLATGVLWRQASDLGQKTDISFPMQQDEVAERLAIEVIKDADRHTALGDAEYAADMLRAILGEY